MNLVTMTFDADEWQVVPKKATVEMINTGNNCFRSADAKTHTVSYCYEAMLTTAPQPPAVSAEPVAYRHLHEDGWEYYDAPTGDDCDGCQALYPAPPSADAKDAARYRWLWLQHAKDKPIAAVVWKRGSDKNSSDWVNIIDSADLDSHIDAAMQKGGE